MGIGMALEQAPYLDYHFGRLLNDNAAKFNVLVNADVHDIEAIFAEEHNDCVKPPGVRGLDEIDIVGAVAAIANAVLHATGQTRARLSEYAGQVVVGGVLGM